MGYDSMNIVEWFEQLLLFGLHVPLSMTSLLKTYVEMGLSIYF